MPPSNIAPTINPFTQSTSNNRQINRAISQSADPTVIFKQPYEVLGGILANDIIQARQMNVPTTDLIKSLIDISKPVVEGGLFGSVAMNANSPKPNLGGGLPPGPPRPPTSGKKDEERLDQAITVDIPQDSMATPSPRQTPSTGGVQQFPQLEASQDSRSKVITPTGFLGRLFQQSGLDRETGEIRTGGLFNLGPSVGTISEAQKVVGEEPLQRGEELSSMIQARSKAYDKNLDLINDSFKKLQEPLPNAKELSLVESAITSLDTLTKTLGISVGEGNKPVITNKHLLKDKNWLSNNRQELLRSRDAYINSKLRRESGAAIGPKEEKKFKETFGFDVGIGSIFQNPEVIAKVLLESKSQLQKDINNLSPNYEARAFEQMLVKKGVPVNERKRILYESGMIG